jgi:hypothetical protein
MDVRHNDACKLLRMLIGILCTRHLSACCGITQKGYSTTLVISLVLLPNLSASNPEDRSAKKNVKSKLAY